MDKVHDSDTTLTNQYYMLPGGRVTALEHDTTFPPVENALVEPNGLLAIGAEVSAERLLAAYRLGIFPWFSPGDPVLWWSPDPRMVLFPHELKVSRSLSKRLKKKDYEIRFNSAFEQVVRLCAETGRKGQNGTWITESIIQGYCALASMGKAMSVETWMEDQLVGGLYGVKLGRMFYGESMFYHRTDASKLAFVHLVYYLQESGTGMIDCQMKTSHLATFGAREIPRSEFIDKLSMLIEE